MFEQVIAPSPWTLPSMGTLMTGLYPSVHGARQPSRVDDLNWMFHPDRFQPVSALHESRETLAEILAARCFATAGFVQGSYAWKARSRALAEKQQLPAPRAAEVDEATRERLRELGYEAGP